MASVVASPGLTAVVAMWDTVSTFVKHWLSQHLPQPYMSLLGTSSQLSDY